MIRRYLLVSLLFVFGKVVLADHLPRNLVAIGPAERVLGGVDIHRSHAKALVDRLGKPASYKKYPETEESAEIVWDKDGSVLHATINVDDVAYAVEVSGRPSELTRTGAGLKVGGTLSDLKRLYGTRFLRRGDDVDLQWKDGTELRVKLRDDRIVSLLLLANVE